MQAFTAARDENSIDQLWLLEHSPVFTQGQAGKPEHVLSPGSIEVVPTDRGGQVTYHGPGQVIIYLLLDLRRRKLGVRQCVSMIEHAVVALLAELNIASEARADAPGVYVKDAKIASLGLRVRRGCCYHGVALNVDMDLSPFASINPCGFSKLPITQLRNLGIEIKADEVSHRLATHLRAQLNSLP